MAALMVLPIRMESRLKRKLGGPRRSARRPLQRLQAAAASATRPTSSALQSHALRRSPAASAAALATPDRRRTLPTDGTNSADKETAAPRRLQMSRTTRLSFPRFKGRRMDREALLQYPLHKESRIPDARLSTERPAALYVARRDHRRRGARHRIIWRSSRRLNRLSARARKRMSFCAAHLVRIQAEVTRRSSSAGNPTIDLEYAVKTSAPQRATVAVLAILRHCERKHTSLSISPWRRFLKALFTTEPSPRT